MFFAPPTTKLGDALENALEDIWRDEFKPASPGERIEQGIEGNYKNCIGKKETKIGSQYDKNQSIFYTMYNSYLADS